MRERAHDLAMLGYRVFPVATRGNRRKQPLYTKANPHPFWCPKDAPEGTTGHKRATDKPNEVLEQWPDGRDVGLGVVMPDGWFVLDSDDYKAPGTTDMLRDAFPELDEAPHQWTANDGDQWFLRLADGQEIKHGASQDSSKPIDTRVGHKGYVVLYPTVTDEGEYRADRSLTPPDQVPTSGDALVAFLHELHGHPNPKRPIGNSQPRAYQPADGDSRWALVGMEDRCRILRHAAARNVALAAAAARAGNFIAGGQLTRETAEQMLLDACADNGLLAEEREKTLDTMHRQIAFGMNSPAAPAPKPERVPKGEPKQPDRPQVALQQEGDDEPWPDPQPLADPTPSAPTVDPQLYPDPLRPWAVDIAERASVSLDWTVPGILISLNATVGNTWRIQPKVNDDWIVVPNTYGALVAPPGMLKSPLLKATMKPLRAIEQELLEKWEYTRHDVEAEQATAKLQQDHAQDQLKAAVKSGDQGAIAKHQKELADLRRDAEQTPRGAPRIIMNDVTREALVERLRDNPRGLLVFRDELYGWYVTLHKQGREGELQFYLEAWDGDLQWTDDRISRGTTTAANNTLSVLGGLQPSRLRALQMGAITGDDADGLLQRIQVLVWPDQLPTYRLVDRAPDHAAVEAATEVYRKLYHLNPADFGFYDGRPGVARFDDEAQQLFNEWLTDLEEQHIRRPELQGTPAWGQYLGKLRSLMPSIALLLHLVDLVTNKATKLSVSLDATRKAAAWVEYLTGHARKVYAPEFAGDQVAAELLLERIANGDISNGDKVRDLANNNWSGLARPELKAGLEVLEDHGWLRVQSVRHINDEGNAVGRPSPRVFLHPDAQELASEAL